MFWVNLPDLPGLMLGGALGGPWFGLLPVLTGVARKRSRLGLAGLIACAATGAVAFPSGGGYFYCQVAASVAVAFFCVILLVSNPSSPQALGPRAKPPRRQAAAGKRRTQGRSGDTSVMGHPGRPEAAHSEAVTLRTSIIRRPEKGQKRDQRRLVS